VQSGEENLVGDLLGWAPLRLPAPATATASSTSQGPVAAATVSTDSAAPAAPAAHKIPTAPKQPFATYADLDPRKQGTVKGLVEDGILTLTDRSATAGDLVYVVVYTPDATIPAGWATVADDRSVTVDLTGISGYAGVTLQGEDGALLGWAPLSLGGAASAETASAETAAVAGDGGSMPLRPVTAGADPDGEWMTGTDGLLLAGGALVLAAVALVTGRAPRRKETVA
jgi:hypothetical protein